MSNIIYLVERKDKIDARPARPIESKDKFEARLARIRLSLNKINSLMQELRNHDNKKQQNHLRSIEESQK